MKELMIDLMNIDKGEVLDVSEMHEDAIEMIITSAWFEIERTENTLTKRGE